MFHINNDSLVGSCGAENGRCPFVFHGRTISEVVEVAERAAAKRGEYQRYQADIDYEVFATVLRRETLQDSDVQALAQAYVDSVAAWFNQTLDGYVKEFFVGDEQAVSPLSRDTLIRECCAIHGIRYADETMPMWLDDEGVLSLLLPVLSVPIRAQVVLNPLAANDALVASLFRDVGESGRIPSQEAIQQYAHMLMAKYVPMRNDALYQVLYAYLQDEDVRDVTWLNGALQAAIDNLYALYADFVHGVRLVSIPSGYADAHWTNVDTWLEEVEANPVQGASLDEIARYVHARVCVQKGITGEGEASLQEEITSSRVPAIEAELVGRLFAT